MKVENRRRLESGVEPSLSTVTGRRVFETRFWGSRKALTRLNGQTKTAGGDSFNQRDHPTGLEFITAGRLNKPSAEKPFPQPSSRPIVDGTRA
jgi:hypothetical protein